MNEETKTRLKSGNACYNSFKNLLPLSPLSKNMDIKLYRTVILTAVLYGYKTCSLILLVEHRIKVSPKRVLMRTFKSNKAELPKSTKKTI
jgi:hypothetical protein